MNVTGDNILFKPFPPLEKTEGGLFVPDSYKEENNKGAIVAVGRGTAKKPMRVKVGDIGFRVKGWGEPIQKDGELYYIMSQDAILALE